MALAKAGAGMTGGDLKGFGALGTNDYNEFYRSRTVYKSDTSFRCLRADEVIE